MLFGYPRKMVALYKLSVKCCGNNNKKRQTTYRKKILFFIGIDYMYEYKVYEKIFMKLYCPFQKKKDFFFR